MFARLVLGYVVALPLVVVLLARAVSDPHTYTFAITMESSIAGHVQVFFDSGAGFREVQSSNAWFETAPGAHEYRLRLPAGAYRQFRIDPGTLPGRYVIEHIAILDPEGATVAEIPLLALSAAYQVTIVEQSAQRVVVTTPAGTSDPQLLYVPPAPLVVPSLALSARRLRLLALVGGALLAGLALVSIAVRAFARPGLALDRAIGQATTFTVRRPAAAVLVAAALATIASTYPIVLGRSFVAPTNGYLRLFYDHPPFAPGTDDTRIEETRGSDVAATVYAFMPYTRIQREALLHGEWPLWNRDNAAGRPLWGQGQSFLLDPLHWIALASPDLTLGWDLKFIAHRFVFASGMGMAALAATGAALPAVVAAASAPFVGVYLFRLNHPAGFALSYAPWALLGWLLLARSRERAERSRAALLIIAALSLVLVASPPKEGVVMLLGVCAAGVLASLRSAVPWSAWRQQIAVAAMAGTAFVLLTAPHWLIFLDTLRLSQTSYDRPHAILAGREHALGVFLTPLVPGLLRPGLNVLAIPLLAAAASAPVRLLRAPAVCACGFTGVCLLATAFGGVPTAWLLRAPLIGNIGHIDDVFVTAAVPLLLIVAAWGAAVLWDSGHLRRAFVAALTVLIGAWLLRQVMWLTKPAGFEPVAVSLVLLPAAALPWLLRGSPAPASNRVRFLAACAAIATVLLPAGLHLNTGLEPLEPLLIQPRPRVAVDAPPPAARAARAALTVPQRIVGLDWWLFSGSQGLYGLEGIGGPDALEVPAYEELVNAGGVTRYWLWLTAIERTNVGRVAPLLDLINVGLLATGADQASPDFEDVPVSPPDRARVGRRRTAWPRAYFVDGVATYGGVADLLQQSGTAGRPIASVLASDRTAVDATQSIARPSGPAVSATDYVLTVNATRFTIVAPGAGLAVLLETYLPGEFRATLNGQPTGYIRVNHAFKGVVIPSAGTWTIEFTHRPRRWTMSLLLAACGALLVGLISLGTRRQ